jgi:hypothetical protein
MSWDTQRKTEIHIPFGRFKSTNLRFNWFAKRKFIKEYFLHLLRIRPVDLSDVSLSNYVAMYYDRLATMSNARLGPGKETFDRYVTNDTVDTEIRNRSKELLTDQLVEDPMLPGGSPRAMVTSLVHDYLSRHPDIKTVVNIGAFVDTQTAYLAPRHSSVQFTSVDRYGDMNKINGYLPHSLNWILKSGYPLDMLARGELTADLFFMTSTSVCCPHRELEAYINLFAKTCRVVIFNEPWWPSLMSFNFLKIPRPEEIKPGTSLLGLAYFNFQSNYIYYLERAGFNLALSRIVPTAGGSLWYTLQIVAENAHIASNKN